MNGDLKQDFILYALKEYFNMVIVALRQQYNKYKIGESGDGFNSFSASTQMLGAGAMGGLSFNEYLRFIDMGVGRAHPLGGLTNTKVTLEFHGKTGFATEQNKTRKPKKFYSKTAYGKLNWLEGKLLYGYTEETIAMLKNNLQNQNA